MDLYETLGIDVGIKKDNHGKYELNGVSEMTSVDWRKVQNNIESQSNDDITMQQEVDAWEKGFYQVPKTNIPTI